MIAAGLKLDAVMRVIYVERGSGSSRRGDERERTHAVNLNFNVTLMRISKLVRSITPQAVSVRAMNRGSQVGVVQAAMSGAVADKKGTAPRV